MDRPPYLPVDRRRWTARPTWWWTVSRGRRPKPTEAKILRGTFRKDRAPKISPSAGRLRAPAWLSPPAQRHYRALASRLRELDLESPAYAQVVALCAGTLAEVEELEQILAEEGRTYITTTATGSAMRRSRPECALLAQARTRAQSLLGELGLSPAAIGKASPVSRTQEKGDDFEF